MGKHGPCRHCGVTNTPLWRNGPPEKPVLCNACGSRWRTKGSLANYTPLHARDPTEWEEHKLAKMKSISLKTKEHKLLKRKQMSGIVENEREMRFCELDQSCVRTFEGNSSNRSSSGSAISCSESCANFGVVDASDWAGSAQSNAWDSSLVPVPSKKRSVIHPKKPSPVEKLTKDLYSIWHEQQSSNLSASSEEDLLYEDNLPMGSVEIGHGGVLLRYPSYKAREEESEASSLPVENKLISEANSRSASFPVNSGSKRNHFSDNGIDKAKNTVHMPQEHVKRDGVSAQNLSLLEGRDSPLRFVDLKDVVSLEVFMKHLTNDEQLRLMKYLPSIDTAKSFESLQSLFSSSSFIENLAYFQQLLQDGVFDLSFCEMSVEECRTLKLRLLNSLKSRWVDHYEKLKDIKHKQNSTENGGENSAKFLHYHLAPIKRTRQIQNGYTQDSKRIMRSPKMVFRSSNTKPPLTKSSVANASEMGSKEALEAGDMVDNEGAFFSPMSLFAWPPDQSTELQFTDDSSDQDLLLDVRCGSSFPEAELLHRHPSNKKTSSNSSSRVESCVAAEEESLCNFPASSFQQLNQHK